MNPGAITFDFHNTLASCDRWFDLEVHHLVPAFLRWRSENGHTPVDPNLETKAQVAYRALRHRVIEHGHEIAAEEGLAHVLRQLDLTIGEEEIAPGVEILMRRCLPDVRPIPGAVETIRQLADAGISLGVVSSAVYHPFVEWAMRRIGLDGVFASITTSASAGFYKSRGEIYATALASLGAAAEHSVHVGDSYRFDVQGAHRAGMKTAWLQGQQQTFPGTPPDIILPHLHGAAEALLTLLKARTTPLSSAPTPTTCRPK